MHAAMTWEPNNARWAVVLAAIGVHCMLLAGSAVTCSWTGWRISLVVFIGILSSQADCLSASNALQVERVTNHDVKAIEYVLKKRMAAHAELAKVHPHTACNCWQIGGKAPWPRGATVACNAAAAGGGHGQSCATPACVTAYKLMLQ